jgi:exopolyphosphatase/guanosine-5'-triphosphate,3'-diphosphate pyrophosphatase
LANNLLGMSEDDIVRKYRLTYPDASTIGAALLCYVRLANLFQNERIFVSNVNLRDGLLNDMAVRGAWTEEFKRQVVRSALALCHKYDVDVAHARHVAELSRTLFRALADEHQLDSHYELLLYLAALLHEIGMFVSQRAHHKHTLYLINNSELFGLSKPDVMLVGLVARYHRRASPKPIHEGYATLDRDGRIAVAKMASLLRVADSLDGSRSQRVREIRCEIKGGQLIVSALGVEDLSLERLALSQKGPLFEEVFGFQVQLRKARA